MSFPLNILRIIALFATFAKFVVIWNGASFASRINEARAEVSAQNATKVFAIFASKPDALDVVDVSYVAKGYDGLIQNARSCALNVQRAAFLGLNKKTIYYGNIEQKRRLTEKFQGFLGGRQIQ